MVFAVGSGRMSILGQWNRESRETPTEKAGLLRRGCEARLREMPQGRRLGMGCDIHVTFMWHSCGFMAAECFVDLVDLRQPYISHYAFPICCGYLWIAVACETLRLKMNGAPESTGMFHMIFSTSATTRTSWRPDVLLWFPAAALQLSGLHGSRHWIWGMWGADVDRSWSKMKQHIFLICFESFQIFQIFQSADSADVLFFFNLL